MIDNTNEMDKGLESALKALEQAKARVANEKKFNGNFIVKGSIFLYN